MAASNIVQIIIQAMDSASGVFKAIGASSGQMGEDVSAAMNKSTKDMAKAQTALVGLKDSLVSSIGSIKGVIADFGMVGIGASVAKAAESWAESVYNLRRAIGGTAQDASQLLAIGKYAGISTDEAATYFAKFGKAISTAKDEMQKASAEGKKSNDIFTRLGLSFNQINGKSVGDVFAIVADKMRTMADGADKDRVAMELFGRSGFQVTEMLNLSKEQIDAVTEKARESGLILDNETTESWHKLGLEVKSVGGVLQGFSVQIGNELLPVLKGQLDAITGLIGAHRSLSPEMQKVIGYSIQAIGMFGEYRLATMALTALAPTLGAALAGPWGLAAAAIGIATAKVLDYIETLHKVPSYNGKAEVRQIGDDGMGHMLHQKKQQINTFMGLPIYDWTLLSPDEEDAQRSFEGRQGFADLKGDTQGAINNQQYADAKAQALVVDTPTTLGAPYVDTSKVDRAAERAAEKLERANERAAQLMADLDRRIMEDASTAYQSGMAKITAEVTKMQNEVAQIGKDSGNTTGLAEKIAEYQQAAAEKVRKAWQQAWTDIKNQTALVGAQLINDKQAQADIEYQIELDKIAKEKEARLKAIAVDGNDQEAKDAVEKWAKGEQNLAAQKRDTTKTDAKLKEYQEALEYDSLLVNLEGKTQQQVDALRQKDLAAEVGYLQQKLQDTSLNAEQRLALQKNLNDALNQQYQLDAERYDTAFSVAFKNIQNQQTNYAQIVESTWNSIYNSLESTFEKMADSGENCVKSIEKYFQTFVQDIENMFIKMWTDKYIMGPMQQLFGQLIGGGSTATVNASGAITSGGQNVGMGGLTNLGHYASGGDNPGGWSVVGEEGPELAYFGDPAHVYTANQTQAILNPSTAAAVNPNVNVTVINKTGQQVSVSQQASYDPGTQSTLVQMVVDGVQNNVAGARDFFFGRG